MRCDTCQQSGVARRSHIPAGEKTLPLIQKYVDDIVTVDEEEIANAIMVLLEREKTLAEGAGAVALAALLQKKTSLKGQRTAVLVCGGNIDPATLARILNGEVP